MSIFNAAARRSVGLEVRAEDITYIERHPPFELSQIKPGQVVFYVSHDEGVDKNSFSKISEAFAYLSEVNNWDINWSIITTDNEDLIDLFAGRPEKEVNIPYKVVVGYWESIAGFASQFFDKDIETIKDSVPEKEYRHISITENKPIVVSIDPKNCPAKKRQGDDDYYSDPYYTQLIQTQPEKGSKQEKELIAKARRELENAVNLCIVLGVDFDVDQINQKIEYALKNNIQYKLELDIKTKESKLLSTSTCTACDIYITDSEGNKENLKLTAVEKAVYLAYLLYDEGLRVEDASVEYRSIVQKIYNQLPKIDKCEKNAGGIIDTYVDSKKYASTLRSYLTSIREAVDCIIPNPYVAQEFAVEGVKTKGFSIQRSTPELREKVKEVFGL